MYTVRLTREAQKAFEAAEAQLQRRLDRCWHLLARAPRHHPNIRKLTGKLSAYYRWRVGDWRVIYRIDDDKAIVWVVAIEHRREAYP